MSVSTRFAGLATAALLTAAAVVAPSAADEATVTDPCAQQQVQVDRAEDALARVTAVFARQDARVAKAKHEVAQAAPGTAKAEARRALARAKHALAETKDTKRAQVQRLAQATERLEACEAAQPTTSPSPTSPSPTAVV